MTISAAGRHAVPAAPLLPPDSGLRDPDLRDRRAMTRRAWMLVGLHLLLPGSAQMLAGDRRLGRIGILVWLVSWITLIIAAVLWFTVPAVLLAVPTSSSGLTVLQVSLLAWGALWLILTVDTLRLTGVASVRPAARPPIVLLLVAALITGTGGAAWGAYLSGVARGTTAAVFGGTKVAAPVAGRFNILLLGGDTDTKAFRLDSVSVISVDAVSGATTIIGVPRTLSSLPLPASSPLAARYPTGYSGRCGTEACDLRTLYSAVEGDGTGGGTGSLYPAAAANHSSPGAEAVRDAVDGALGIRVQYVTVLDMQAFKLLVDAVGGITVDVPSRTPIGDEVDANGDSTGTSSFIEAGRHHMNGSTALRYVRSRAGGPDDGSVLRLRQVEVAMLRELNPANLLLKFQAVASAGSASISTDIPEDQLGRLAALAIKGRSTPVASLDLVPPRISSAVHPDYSALQAAVAAAIG